MPLAGGNSTWPFCPDAPVDAFPDTPDELPVPEGRLVDVADGLVTVAQSCAMVSPLDFANVPSSIKAVAVKGLSLAADCDPDVPVVVVEAKACEYALHKPYRLFPLAKP